MSIEYSPQSKKSPDPKNTIKDVHIDKVQKGIVLTRDWNDVSDIFSILLNESDHPERALKRYKLLSEARQKIGPPTRPDYEWEKHYGDILDIPSNEKIIISTKRAIPYIVVIDDDEQIEESLAAKLGLERASYSERVIVEFANQNGRSSINLADVGQRIDSALPRTLKKDEVSGMKMANYFKTKRAPYILGQANGFRLQTTLEGFGMPRSVEERVILQEDTAEGEANPRLTIEVSQRDDIFPYGRIPVYDQSQRLSMEETAKSIAEAFKPEPQST